MCHCHSWQQFAAYSGLEKFAAGIEATVDGDPLPVTSEGNTIVIGSNDKLRDFYIAPVELKTKSGESLWALAKRTIGERGGKLELIAIERRCH